MSLSLTSRKPSEAGFTLVELAIVMVIIGLLIGGVLKGQELIAGAKISSTVTQLKNIDASLNNFYNKYAAYPGDMQTPNTRLPSCTTAPCSTAGDGDSRIEATGAVFANPLAATEAYRMFVQLSAADMFSGVNAAGGATAWGGVFPTASVGGGLWVSYATAVPVGTTAVVNRHYAVLAGVPNGAATVANGALTGVVAAQIDRKIDDSRPLTGATQTIGTTCATGAGAAAVYNELGAGTCTMVSRVLN